MIHDNAWTFNQLRVRSWAAGPESSLYRIAAARYQQARVQARLGQILALLRRRPSRLWHLGSLEAQGRLRSARYAGLRAVPIRDIQGSEGRCDDFDADFCPLTTHNRWRWLRLAAAWRRGVVLPPVELIQVGDVYFVRDGHHRISVARAFGQEQIDAEVTVWDVAGPLPWQPNAGKGLLSLPAGLTNPRFSDRQA